MKQYIWALLQNNTGWERDKSLDRESLAMVSWLLGLDVGVDDPVLFCECSNKNIHNKKLKTKPTKVHRHFIVYILLSRFNQF